MTRPDTPRQNFSRPNLRLRLRLPAALREWYALNGRRGDIWSRQDLLLPLEVLEVTDGWLPFYMENQGLCQCGIRLAGFPPDDPPVGTQRLGEATPWSLAAANLSAFTLTLLVYNVRCSSSTAGTTSGLANALAARIVEEHYQRLAVPDFPWWTYIARFFGDPYTMIAVSEEHTNLWVTVTARTEHAFQRCIDLLKPADIRWKWPCSMYD